MFILTVFSLMFGMALYLVLRLVRPLPVPCSVKIALGLFVFLLAQKTLLMRFLWPALSSIPIPPLLQLGLSVVYAALIIAFLLSLTADVACILAIIFRSRLTLEHTKNSLATLAFATLCISTFGVWQALSVPKVREVTLYVPHLEDLAPDLEGMRIAHISDMHIGPVFRGAWLARVVEATNAAKPDLVVLTGDIVDAKVEAISDEVQLLRRFSAPLGTIMSVGNHEYISGFDEWVRVLRELGIRVLLNEHTILTEGKSALVVAGVTDPAAEYRGGELPNPYKALQGAPSNALRIMLAHQPALFEQSVDAGADIQLSGHTHGGTIFFLQALVASLNGGFIQGLYEHEDALLYVNTGAGLWDGFPLRLGVPSEIVILTLQAK